MPLEAIARIRVQKYTKRLVSGVFWRAWPVQRAAVPNFSSCECTGIRIDYSNQVNLLLNYHSVCFSYHVETLTEESMSDPSFQDPSNVGKRANDQTEA